MNPQSLLLALAVVTLLRAALSQFYSADSPELKALHWQTFLFIVLFVAAS